MGECWSLVKDYMNSKINYIKFSYWALGLAASIVIRFSKDKWPMTELAAFD